MEPGSGLIGPCLVGNVLPPSLAWLFYAGSLPHPTPEPYTLDTAPCTLYPEHSTFHPKSDILHPTPPLAGP